jgi:hypothetical protein
LGTQIPCPGCGELLTLRETAAAFRGKRLRYWSDCTCVTNWVAAYEQQRDGSAAYQATTRGAAWSDLDQVKHLTLDTFQAARYPSAGNPYVTAAAWLDSILGELRADYHRGHAACLYFYSAGKGRGKTHLAAGLGLRAQEAGKRVFFADEVGYIERFWAASLEEKLELSRAASETAWLTILDDLGQRERTTDSLRDAWYDVVNPRWLCRGWTIVTSNCTPDELLARGTINAATYSRLTQMCKKTLIPFESADYRTGGGR